MRRLAALGLIAGIVEIAGLSAALHTHTYTEHDHAEHRHGLAAHSHHDNAVRASDDHRDHDDHDGLKWTRCDPGLHQRAVRFVSAGPLLPDISLGCVEEPFVRVSELKSDALIALTDVRVHGPPVRGHTSPRAPPLIALRSIT